MTPKLTVITPSFNQAAFIERTIRSVLDQGYENLEYMIVDGGSSDGSVEVIESYSEQLAWWVSERDRGQTDALNKALARATGDIVAYINSDDYYLPGAFGAAVSRLEVGDCEWAVGSARFVDAEDRLSHVWRPELAPRRRHRWIVGPVGWPQAATFWRRRVFEAHGFFREDMNYIFDTEFGIRLAFAGLMPGFIDREIAARVVHPEAKSWNPRDFELEERRLLRLYGRHLSPREFALMVGAEGHKRMASGYRRVTGRLSRTGS